MNKDLKRQIQLKVENLKKKRLEYSKRYRKNNLEKIRENKRKWNKKWRLENPLLAKLRSQEDHRRRNEKIRKMSQRQKEIFYKYHSQRIEEWRKRNPEKRIAHRIVFVALRNKSLKKELCHCGELKVEAHHIDYSKPLQIEWLCKKHHCLADRLRKMIPK